MLNVGESLRGKGAPCWFIFLYFLSNRRKKKENTSLYVRLRPRRSQVTPDRAESRCSLKFARRCLSSSSRQNINRPNFSAPFRRGCGRSELPLHFLISPPSCKPWKQLEGELLVMCMLCTRFSWRCVHFLCTSGEV